MGGTAGTPRCSSHLRWINLQIPLHQEQNLISFICCVPQVNKTNFSCPSSQKSCITHARAPNWAKVKFHCVTMIDSPNNGSLDSCFANGNGLLISWFLNSNIRNCLFSVNLRSAQQTSKDFVAVFAQIVEFYRWNDFLHVCMVYWIFVCFKFPSHRLRTISFQFLPFQVTYLAECSLDCEKFEHWNASNLSVCLQAASSSARVTALKTHSVDITTHSLMQVQVTSQTCVPFKIHPALHSFAYTNTDIPSHEKRQNEQLRFTEYSTV